MRRGIFAALIASSAIASVAGRVQAGLLFVAQGSDKNSFTRIDELGATTTFPAGHTVTGLAIDTSGILYLTFPNDNRIEKFSADGVDMGQFATINGASGGQYLAFDSAGNLYVSNHSDNTIREFSPTGVDLGNFATTGLSTPEGLRFDAQGNLYVANYTSNSVHEFSPTGADLGTFATAGLNHPSDVAFDSQGNLYVSNYFGDDIHKFSPSGLDLGIFAASGLTNPNGLAFDATGNLYASNNVDVGGTIRHFSSSGVDLGAFAQVNDGGQLAFSTSAVPEPASIVLWSISALSVLGYRRLRRPSRLRGGLKPHES